MNMAARLIGVWLFRKQDFAPEHLCSSVDVQRAMAVIEVIFRDY